jgi:hypothetical protein
MTPQKGRGRQPAHPVTACRAVAARTRRVDSVSAGPITVLVLFFPVDAVDGVSRGSRMGCPTTGIALERREAPGPSHGPAPRDPHPPRSALGSRNLGADRPIARPVRGAIASSPAPPGAPTPHFEGNGKKERAGPAARKSEVAGQRSVAYPIGEIRDGCAHVPPGRL